ncbi:transglutaminase family protein [Yimella sp. cx-51]|uniref:transglutaminase family protein n=1 Tax=Yimella sp. cx-51 TaxID=2770551 RepID=UPI00165DABEB|nr:transglutaminase family protein [Yimella sp. cx-51]MBC9957377.1 transglutaminase family protein [Yimella sp. cx-51]MBD2760326.1 transglutaminase family protein [Yimella sp. cx-573]QTH39382.1 transglutaminase family protein [Yimella sp. cx-51]
MSDDLHGTKRYEVRHVTEYTYDDYVTASYGRACLRPRATDHQVVTSNLIEVSPRADVMSEHTDFFGNFSHYLEIRNRHTVLRVKKTSQVEVSWPRVDVDALNKWTIGQARAEMARVAAGRDVDHLTYLLPSQLVAPTPAVQAYAREHLPDDRPLGEALVNLYELIYSEFKYAKGATNNSTTLDELLANKAGVCQDFAHLAVGMCRVVGLPARYVSGYIETQPPPGKQKLEGSDATHAWMSVRTPLGWNDLDPTNNHFADSRYIVTAWGRDFRDVSPMKGVIFTESKSSKLKVGVDVLPLSDKGVPLQEPLPAE